MENMYSQKSVVFVKNKILLIAFLLLSLSCDEEKLEKTCPVPTGEICYLPQDVPNEEIEGWELAIEFFPVIKNQYDELKKISGILANTFRAALIATKSYDDSTAIKEKFENDYFIRFYGDNSAIRDFAKRLLINRHTKAAIKLNKILRFMGNSLDPDVIKNKLFEEFPNTRKGQYSNKEISEIDKLVYAININSFLTRDLVELLEKMHGIKVNIKTGLLSDSFSFTLNGKIYDSISSSDLLILCRNEIQKWKLSI